MAAPDIKIGHCGNVYTRMMIFKNKGDIEETHTHDFNHVTLVSSGSVRITVSGEETDFVAPQFIFVHKNAEHKLEALEDNTVCACIHATRDEEGDIIASEFIPKGVTRDPWNPTAANADS